MLRVAHRSLVQSRCRCPSRLFSTARSLCAAVGATPSHAELLQRAHLALSRQDLPEARDLFETLTKQPGATLDSYYNLGVVEWLQKRPDQAVRHWHAAIAQHDKSAGAGASSKALSEEVEETLSSCHTNLANYYLLFKPDLQAALCHLKAAVALRPSDGEVRYNYAVALERADEIELALENYLRAEELGVKKNIDQLIRNAGAKLVKRNSQLPPTPQEMLDSAKLKADAQEEIEPRGTIVDRDSGDGR